MQLELHLEWRSPFLYTAMPLPEGWITFPFLFHPFPSFSVLNVPGLLKLDIFTVLSLPNGKQKSESIMKKPSECALISSQRAENSRLSVSYEKKSELSSRRMICHQQLFSVQESSMAFIHEPGFLCLLTTDFSERSSLCILQ